MAKPFNSYRPALSPSSTSLMALDPMSRPKALFLPNSPISPPLPRSRLPSINYLLLKPEKIMASKIFKVNFFRLQTEFPPRVSGEGKGRSV